MASAASDHDLIERLYAAYNARDLDGLSALVREDVEWPDAAERLHGRAAARAYWSEQWTRVHTHDDVLGVGHLAPGRVAVRVRTIVHDLEGRVVSRGMFEHVFLFQDGLVARMDLRRLSPEEVRDNGAPADEAMVRRLYDRFNARDIPAVLAVLDPQVEWANGMEGGHVHGREALRRYWTRQWAAVDPRVEPMNVQARDDGSLAVEVRQVVHDLEGALLLDETVRHVFQIEGGRVTRFDIENAGGLSAIAHG